MVEAALAVSSSERRVCGVIWIRVPDGIEYPDPPFVVRGCDQFR
jgi:hypothetical protein